jgi:hypothetical protein
LTNYIPLQDGDLSLKEVEYRQHPEDHADGSISTGRVSYVAQFKKVDA